MSRLKLATKSSHIIKVIEDLRASSFKLDIDTVSSILLSLANLMSNSTIDIGSSLAESSKESVS